MKTPRNQRTVNVKMTRKDLCDLIVACTTADVVARKNALGRGETVGRTHWNVLHDILKEQLDAFDKKLDEEE